MRRFVLPALAMMACAILPATAGASTLHATPSTLQSTYASAQGGDTILLAAGSYASWGGGSKPSMVTVAPENGASVSFKGGDFGSGVRNLTIKGVTYTGPVEVDPGSTPLNLVFDGDTWGNVGQGTHEGRLSIIGGGAKAIGGNGVQVKNSTFGPGGCSDGIQDSSNGTEIGPGNEFKGITQSCSSSQGHVDSIQPYASNYVWIHDNYLHDNEQGIMSPDGVSTGYRIENNVIHTSTDYPCMHLGDTRNGVVRHNVCRNGAIRVFGGNQNVASQSMTVQDNVADLDASACSNCTINHNVSPGSVTFTGGTGRCAYATASPKGTGSDGTDLGLNDCSGTTPPPPPNDHTPAAAFVYNPASPTVGSNVTFDASSSTCDDAPCVYHWHDIGSDGSGDWPLGPDGKTSAFAFHETGVKYVELVVTDADGDQSTVHHNVTVSDGPPPPPSDRDGDGVPDASDACPDQPGTQPNGCPPPDPGVCDQACVDNYKSQIASLTTQLADMTTSRDNVQALADAYKARAEAAEAAEAALQARIDAALADLKG